MIFYVDLHKVFINYTPIGYYLRIEEPKRIVRLLPKDANVTIIEDDFIAVIEVTLYDYRKYKLYVFDNRCPHFYKPVTTSYKNNYEILTYTN